MKSAGSWEGIGRQVFSGEVWDPEISEGERTLLVIIIMILINIIIVSLPTLDPVSFHLTFLTTL